jgi:hypothetical protein
VPSSGILEDGTDWLKMVPVGYTETSPTNYESTLRKISGGAQIVCRLVQRPSNVSDAALFVA